MNETTRKHLESLCLFQWVLTYLFMGIFWITVLFYLMFTSLWLIPVLYFIWVFIDRDTPERGGRRAMWFRNWIVWKYVRNYFPIKTIKTADLSPDRNYIFGCHPHGILCAGAFYSFASDSTGFPEIFPGIKPTFAVLAGLFRLPVYRDYLMLAGVCSVSKSSLDYVLSKTGTGNAVAIAVGGAAESLNCVPGEERVVLINRKGFIRLALENGADLVPVYTFGENDLYEQVVFEEGSWGKTLQTKFQKLVGFAPCLFMGRGVFSPNSWGLNPFAKPVYTVVGKPIRVPHIPVPSSQEVDRYHRLYMDGLLELFEQHKTQYGLPPSCLLRFI
ncbi:2-acylglycerol O-acyltransferase 3 [Lissotriton helveticus]